MITLIIIIFRVRECNVSAVLFFFSIIIFIYIIYDLCKQYYIIEMYTNFIKHLSQYQRSHSSVKIICVGAFENFNWITGVILSCNTTDHRLFSNTAHPVWKPKTIVAPSI